jgi:hypothetical protein
VKGSDGPIALRPPLNTILAESTGEILPSEITAEDFDCWWGGGTDLAQFEIVEASS